MKTIIYFFTGTGNSLKVAKDLSQYIDNVEVVLIYQEQLNEELKTDADIVGFVFPTIFSGIPKLLGRFIQHINTVNPSPYIFAIATHGDRKGVGIGFEQIEELLAEKSLSLSASFGVHMPHNMPEKDHVTTFEEKKHLFEQEAEHISRIAEHILKRETIAHYPSRIKSFFERMTYNGVHKMAKNHPLDKGFCIDEKCIGCSICSKVCPGANIEMVNRKPKWKLENCQFCFACVQWCPKEAIQYKKGTIGIERYHHPEINVDELLSHRDKKI